MISKRADDRPRSAILCSAWRARTGGKIDAHMTVLVSVKINDGVVMAADSASSFASGMVYRHADKIVNLRQGLPIGVMVTGAGGIGNESIDTLLKDLRRRFEGKDEARRDWALDPECYTLAQVANLLRTFLSKEKAAAYAGRSGETDGQGCDDRRHRPKPDASVRMPELWTDRLNDRTPGPKPARSYPCTRSHVLP